MFWNSFEKNKPSLKSLKLIEIELVKKIGVIFRGQFIVTIFDSLSFTNFLSLKNPFLLIQNFPSKYLTATASLPRKVLWTFSMVCPQCSPSKKLFPSHFSRVLGSMIWWRWLYTLSWERLNMIGFTDILKVIIILKVVCAWALLTSCIHQNKMSMIDGSG